MCCLLLGSVQCLSYFQFAYLVYMTPVLFVLRVVSAPSMCESEINFIFPEALNRLFLLVILVVFCSGRSSKNPYWYLLNNALGA